MSRRGKNADLAAPTRALAAAIARSAAAISGRRSSSVDGRPAGTDTATFCSGCGGMAKSDGARPSSTASACSAAAAAVDAQRLGLRLRQLGPGARQVQLADVAGVIAALDQLQRLGAQLHCLAVELRLGVLLAHQEVGGGDVGLQRQQHRAVQRFALLRVGGGGVGR